MFIERYGKGGRVFFGLHGWSGDHTTFAPLTKYLPEDATLYSVDLPGVGQSPPPLEWSLGALTSEVAAEISRLDSRSITMIGSCSGALLSLATLPLIAERVNRLVLIDPFAYVPWYFKVFVATPIGKYAYYSTFANPLGRWVTNLSLKRHRTGETDLTSAFQAVDHGTSYHYLRILCAMNGIERISWIRHQIDILHGGRTFGAVKRSIGMWRGVWPHARIYELEGAGHLPIEEATEDLSRIVFGPRELPAE